MYHITYRSGPYKVKGYFSFPYGHGISDGKWRAILEENHWTRKLPVVKIAETIAPVRLDAVTRRWPALIYCRGGIGNVGKVQTHWLEKFCRHGHVVFAPSYRGNEGGQGRDEFGGSDVEDVISAFRLLKELPFVDESRISLMGFSRGSINAALAAAALPSIRKLVIWSGVADLGRTYEERVDLRKMLKRVIGGNPSKLPKAYSARSPLVIAPSLGCPVLVIHGTDDAQVAFGHGLDLYNKLRENGAQAEFHPYRGEGHHFSENVHREAIGRMFRWLTDEDLDVQA